MDRTPAPEPYPPVSPTPAAPSSGGGGGGKGIVVAYAIGGVMVALAGVLPRAQLLLGSDVVAETKSGLQSGLSIGLVLIGVLMIVRIFTVARRIERGGAVVLFIGPLIALFLVVQDIVRVKNVLTDWMLSTGACPRTRRTTVSSPSRTPPSANEPGGSPRRSGASASGPAIAWRRSHGTRRATSSCISRCRGRAPSCTR